MTGKPKIGAQYSQKKGTKGEAASMGWRTLVMAVLAPVIYASATPLFYNSVFDEIFPFFLQALYLGFNLVKPMTLAGAIIAIIAVLALQFIPVYFLALSIKRYVCEKMLSGSTARDSDCVNNDAKKGGISFLRKMYFPYLLTAFLIVQLLCFLSNKIMPGGH